jgi:chemotaxis protein CheD
MVLGIGDYGFTDNSMQLVKTFALGSCVALIIHDKSINCTVMAHIALSDSSIHPERAKTKPGYFADTGVKICLKTLKLQGSQLMPSHLRVKLAGGSNIADRQQFFKIGEKNIQAVNKHLAKYNLRPVKSEVGGAISRTVTIDNTGKVVITSPGRRDIEI